MVWGSVRRCFCGWEVLILNTQVRWIWQAVCSSGGDVDGVLAILIKQSLSRITRVPEMEQRSIHAGPQFNKRVTYSKTLPSLTLRRVKAPCSPATRWSYNYAHFSLPCFFLIHCPQSRWIPERVIEYFSFNQEYYVSDSSPRGTFLSPSQPRAYDASGKSARNSRSWWSIQVHSQVCEFWAMETFLSCLNLEPAVRVFDMKWTYSFWWLVRTGSSNITDMPLACPQPSIDSSGYNEDCLSMILYVPPSLVSFSSAPTLMWSVVAISWDITLLKELQDPWRFFHRRFRQCAWIGWLKSSYCYKIHHCCCSVSSWCCKRS